MEISGYMPMISAAQRVELPPLGGKKKKACSSLVTASMNEKQLEGMLHYHPISNAGGGVLTLLEQFVCVCVVQNQVSEGEQGGLVAVACRPPVGLSFLLLLLLLAELTRPLHFLICPGQASFLSAINLRLHPPIFIPSTVCFSFTSCSLGLEQIYARFDHRSLHSHDDS